MNEARVQSTIEIAAPVDKVWNFLVDPKKIPLVLPGLVENVNVPALPLKEGSQFQYRYQMYGVMTEGTWKVTKLEPKRVYDAVTDGDVESRWHYEVSEREGKTHVALDVTYRAPQSVLGKIKAEALAKINQAEGEHYLQNLKTVLEMA